MAQGKLKVKTKLPKNIKNKKQMKGSAITKRANCPVKSKKKNEQARKLKEIVSKTVNKTVEEEIRSRASPGKQNLSKAQKAVADHHLKMTTK